VGAVVGLDEAGAALAAMSAPASAAGMTVVRLEPDGGDGSDVPDN